MVYVQTGNMVLLILVLFALYFIMCYFMFKHSDLRKNVNSFLLKEDLEQDFLEHKAIKKVLNNQ